MDSQSKQEGAFAMDKRFKGNGSISIGNWEMLTISLQFMLYPRTSAKYWPYVS
jgi:hypothetical protein